MGEFLDLKGFLSFLILHELKRKPLCGEDLAKKIGRRKGSEPLTPGTIYPALKELRNAGLVVFEQFGRKKVYSLTDMGGAQLALLYEEFSVYFYGLKKHIKRPRQKKRSSKKSKQKANNDESK